MTSVVTSHGAATGQAVMHLHGTRMAQAELWEAAVRNFMIHMLGMWASAKSGMGIHLLSVCSYEQGRGSSWNICGSGAVLLREGASAGLTLPMGVLLVVI